jgi:uncharacterized protein (UPF0548 family)
VTPADLATLELTYSPVGLSQEGALPAGFHHVVVERRIGHGPGAFERARASLLTYGAQRGTGLRPRATAPTAAPGVDLLCHLGVGRLALPVPCRVVWVVDGKDRAGFGYGTLEGHVESGEEGFLVELRGDEVYAVVRAYSVPVNRVMRRLGPVARLGQRAVAVLYTVALARAARG